MQKILWLDCETTGLDVRNNELLTIAGLVELDGEIRETFYLKIKPVDAGSWSAERFPTWDKSAEETHGISLEEALDYEANEVVYNKLTTILNKYVNIYNKHDKLYIGGYNVQFDLDFVSKFIRQYSKYGFGSYTNWRKIDVLYLFNFLQFNDFVHVPDMKLKTVCHYLGVPLTAHDALSDITATHQLYQRINRVLLTQHHNIAEFVSEGIHELDR